MLGSVLGLLILVSGMPVAAATCYLLILVAACLLYRPAPAVGPPRSRLAVLVPAHDEAETIGRCLQSLLSQQYPRHLYRIVVIADNCSDETANVATAAGAEVMVRDVPQLRGKGYALRWAIDRLLSEANPPDAVIIVDADSRTDPGFLIELEAWFASGHDVVQADSCLEPEPGSPRANLEVAAMILRGRVRYAALTALRLPAGLCGNGMALSRAVLEAHPWEAYSPTEDAEQNIRLLLAGLRPVFAVRAHLSSPTTPSEQGAYTQGLRWESGRFAAMRYALPKLLRVATRRRDLRLLARGIDGTIPPLTMLAAITFTGTILAAALVFSGVAPAVVLVPWAVAQTALPLYVVLGLAAGRAPAATYLALLSLPWFLQRKLRVYAHLATNGLERSWVRTQRPGEVPRGPR